MSKDIETTINFIPSNASIRSMTGTVDFYTNAKDKRAVRVYDARGREHEFNLSKNGFCYTTSPTMHIPISDPKTIKSDVYPEIASLLETSIQPPPTRVKVVSHTIRSSLTDVNSEYTGTPGPARAAHLDHTPSGAKVYLYQKLPGEEAFRLSRTRWAIINVWRPLKTVARDPLAVCDGSTLQEGDLLPIGMDYSANIRAKDPSGKLRTTVGWEIAMLKYSARQRWYYLSGMGVEDVLLMKIYDSKITEPMVAVHSSFEDPGSQNTEARESIEFRCLVFWEND